MSNVTIEEIAGLTAAEFNVAVADMQARFHVGGRNPERPPALVARNIAMWLARRHTQMTYKRIGAFFGIGRAESVREYALAAGSWRKVNLNIREAVERIERNIDDIHEARLEAELGPM